MSEASSAEIYAELDQIGKLQYRYLRFTLYCFLRNELIGKKPELEKTKEAMWRWRQQVKNLIKQKPDKYGFLDMEI